MAQTPVPSASHTWLIFAIMAFSMWGLYGVFLHSGQTAMGDPVNGRFKAFLIVGSAYVLIAFLLPIAILLIRGANWQMPVSGVVWSLLAGIVGAVGAFCVLMAFQAKGMPSVVMSIIFAGAPIVNAVVALWMHPPAGGWSALRWQFVAGILFAALGGCMVSLYKPPPAPAQTPPPATERQAPS